MTHRKASESTDAALSPHLARLWRLTPPERRGRPARLTLDLVVGRAVELADAAGLDAVTIPRVAQAVGCSTMALYRHVSSKDELLVLMTDLAAGAPPGPDDITADSWRENLRGWADALHAVVSAHPWITRVPINGPPAGPGHMAWLDAALRALRGAALPLSEKVAVVTLISGYIHQAVRLTVDHAAGMGDDPEGAYQAYGAALAGLVQPARFPDAAELFVGQAFAPATAPSEDLSENYFHLGLEIILDGIERKYG